jgi:integrase
LNKLFSSPVFVGREIKPKVYGIASAMPWATVLALFSGLGLEEVCELRPQDIYKEGAHWVIRVTPEAAISGHLKRKGRDRTVPLHPELERVGFMKYVRALPSGSTRVFPGLPVDENKKKLGASVGKSFNRWRCALGIDYADRQLDFHSLRHTFGKQIEDAGITAEDRARLLGHALKGISSSVYSSPELKRVGPQIAGIKWDGLKIV